MGQPGSLHVGGLLGVALFVVLASQPSDAPHALLSHRAGLLQAALGGLDIIEFLNFLLSSEDLAVAVRKSVGGVSPDSVVARNKLVGH